MKKTQKIGWQKYEDLLEAQINSPLMDIMLKAIDQEMSLETEENEDISYKDPIEDEEKEDSVLININKDMSGEITLAANFDCWMGHTNFNLTEDIKESLNKIDGIEVLKICSRYRFFVGVGRMFDFSDVRKNIEDQIIK
jgi:hypothetical protein